MNTGQLDLSMYHESITPTMLQSLAPALREGVAKNAPDMCVSSCSFSSRSRFV